MAPKMRFLTALLGGALGESLRLLTEVSRLIDDEDEVRRTSWRSAGGPPEVRLLLIELRRVLEPAAPPPKIPSFMSCSRRKVLVPASSSVTTVYRTALTTAEVTGG
jgi:hypothetical protein